MNAEMLAYYGLGYEQGRLQGGVNQLERARTQALIERYLPPAPAVVYDVGGGSGPYARWLAQRGYTVHLLDVVPLHIEQAQAASAAQPEHPLASAAVGDARQLEWPDASADAVLLLGPLYHLTEKADRVGALSEAARVLRPGGVVLAAVISRFASTLTGLFFGQINDPTFAQIAAQDLVDGQHRNPTSKPGYFTTAYFHRPEELGEELIAAGLRHVATVPVEGPGWLPAPERFEAEWADPERRARLLATVQALEGEPSLLGMSPHILGIGTRP